MLYEKIQQITQNFVSTAMVCDFEHILHSKTVFTAGYLLHSSGFLHQVSLSSNYALPQHPYSSLSASCTLLYVTHHHGFTHI